ncbi:hypothetical protein [Enterovirga aerilata]|uniref:Uncharacterized protein n=1 Tax=Enterovirga aerilata TaxID=2730920 RepID=A0A849IDJ2_9HYPH|nr:hypothetical protein [Enterovirga sp. DB1703]NNM71973.1 hypothetical protein [Enterovirga sp. DB1703]
MAWLFQGSETELLGLSDLDFIEVWSALFGEPPAAMIDRAQMVGLMRSALEPDAAPAFRSEARAVAARHAWAAFGAREAPSRRP